MTEIEAKFDYPSGETTRMGDDCAILVCTMASYAAFDYVVSCTTYEL